MMRIDWLSPFERVGYELTQLREEGADYGALERAWLALPTDEQHKRAAEFLDRATEISPSLQRAAEREAFVETLSGEPKRRFPKAELLTRLEAAWLGRAAGCQLGKPVESATREAIRAILQSVGEYPLRQYFTFEGVPPALIRQSGLDQPFRRDSLRESMVCMPEDDDLNYPMLNLSVVERFGPEFTTDDVALTWLEALPVLATHTAERLAYLNLLQGFSPPHSATRHNPYREWIGAQIRADLWGYMHPGDPASAAKAAFRDARLSHLENGIFGEMMAAAMVAQAFVARDVNEIIQAGLKVIPADSRLAQAVEQTLQLDLLNQPWDTTLDALYANLGHYHWVHTLNNAALVVAALVYGQGDYERTVTAAVMGGWDTDCNGATVGSIVGLMKGEVPQKWTAPLNNRVRSSLKGFDHSSFDDLARRTLAVIPTHYLEP